MMKQWIQQPLIHPQAIEDRLNVVEQLINYASEVNRCAFPTIDLERILYKFKTVSQIIPPLSTLLVNDCI